MSVTLRPRTSEYSHATKTSTWSWWRLIAVFTSAVLLVGACVLAAFAHPPTATPEIEDWAGRVGFVAFVAVALTLVWLLDARARRPVVPEADIFVPLRLIVGLFAVLAATWAVYSNLVLDAFSRGKFGYLEWLTQMMNLVAARGIWNVWTPYPQGTQELLVGLQTLAAALAGLLNSDVWTGFTLFRLGFEVVFLVGPAIALVWLVGATGKSFGRSTQTVGSLTMALSFGIVYYGAASAYVTDPLPAALCVVAILAVLRHRFGWAGAAIGLGAALKLFPILLLPALIVLLPRRAFARVVGVAAGVMAPLLLPGLIANPEIFVSPLNWQSGRPAWESWYAFVNWVSGVPHVYPQPYFQDASVGAAFGWVFTGITPRISVLQMPVPAGPLRWENVVSGVGTLLTLLLCLTARSRSPRSIVRWGLFCLTGFLVFGIGWSPQYELFLIPFILLAFESPLVGATVALSLQAVTFLEYPLLLPWAQFYGGSAVWLAWGAILARYILLGWLCLWLLRSEANMGALQARFRKLLGVARIVPVVVAVLPLTVHAAGQDQTVQMCGPTRYVPMDPVTFSAERDWQVPGGWFFSQAGVMQDHGYTILDDSDAMMWSEFNRLGGWQALGFPASRRFTWHGLLSQASQRAILQWSPITGQVEFANVLDLMHDDGRDMDLWRLKQIPPPVDLDEAGLPYETIAAHRLAWLDSRPAIKEKYCNAPGGADPVQLWGLPTSEAVNVSDSGGEVYVLRTQRAGFQEWVAGADWAAPGQVTVVLAGDIAKQFNLLPSEATVPELAPAR